MGMDDTELIKTLLTRLDRKALAEIRSHLDSCYATSGQVDGPSMDEAESFDLTGMKLAIEFCESSAANFSRALSIAKTAPSFSTRVDRKKAWYLAGWPTNDFLAAVPLVQALAGIRNKRCFVDNSEVDWSDALGFSNCAADKVRAYRPDQYCFGGENHQAINPWGCMHAKLDWSDWSRWFCYGHFTEEGNWSKSIVWNFDKKRIRHELEKNLFKVRLCPHLKPNFVEAVLLALPDKVYMRDHGDWKYHRNYEMVPGSVKVIEKRGDSGLEFTEEYYADGITPFGHGALKKILESAFQECGMSNAVISGILKDK
jgi:hypothetical protein